VDWQHWPKAKGDAEVTLWASSLPAGIAAGDSTSIIAVSAHDASEELAHQSRLDDDDVDSSGWKRWSIVWTRPGSWRGVIHVLPDRLHPTAIELRLESGAALVKSTDAHLIMSGTNDANLRESAGVDSISTALFAMACASALILTILAWRRD
jgi:hypothetical protein